MQILKENWDGELVKRNLNSLLLVYIYSYLLISDDFVIILTSIGRKSLSSWFVTHEIRLCIIYVIIW